MTYPRYDDKTDSFIDGPIPQSADTFFDNKEKMKEFFEIKHITPNHESSENKSH